MSDCIFCKIVAGEIPSYTVYEDEQFVVFLDRNPINPGHILVVPRQHIDDAFGIPEPLYGELFTLAKRLSFPLKEATASPRTGLVIEGFGVAHAHVHLIPIYKGNELNPERAHGASPEELKEMGERIRNAFI